MVMLCWFYCIPFMEFLYYAAGPALFIFSLFVLKRGIRMARKNLRTLSYGLMAISAIKVFLFDLHLYNQDLFCGFSASLKQIACNPDMLAASKVIGILFLLLSGFGIYSLQRRYAEVHGVTTTTIEAVRLRFWANTSMWCVSIMVLWQLAPWVGSLTVGYVPAVFTAVPWQMLAFVNMALLLVGFWKVESCNWVRSRGQNTTKLRYVNNVWTPKDTLWMSLSVFLVTLALSYVAHDVMTTHTS